MMFRRIWSTVFVSIPTARIAVAITLAFLFLSPFAASAADRLQYGWQKVDGINIFYREGGPANGPTIVFLHGTPASSIQYEGVMEQVVAATGAHVIAMDYPSFGYSDAPDHQTYKYTFDNIAVTVAHFLEARKIERYALFMQDYGVPVGFRLMVAKPKAVTAIMVQNGVIHLDGFPVAQDPNGEVRRHWQERNPEVDKRRTATTTALKFPNAGAAAESATLGPDAILLRMVSEQRPGVIEARNDLWFDYGSNLAHYPQWQDLLKSLKLPVLIVWGDRDKFFTTPGAKAFLREAPQAELHVLDVGHFATLEVPGQVASLTADFVKRHLH
jgi:pimeloyl-ACP methyl ester carboxylesterase